jgi:hypothetical protein
MNGWICERNYDWMIRKKWYLKIIDIIICKGIMTDIARPQDEILQKKPFIRIFNSFNIVFWSSKKYNDVGGK